jgi:hypothetical protein
VTDIAALAFAAFASADDPKAKGETLTAQGDCTVKLTAMVAVAVFW